nr:zinc finger, CCHC-type, retrotransposon Gag domain protein [Tanacetum cinerariifolium]
MQRFLRLDGFLGAAAGTEEEQVKNFQWGLRRSTLNHLMRMSYTDVAQVANAARNYEILHERRTRSDQTSGRGVVIGISRPLSRVVTGATVIITTVMHQTGEVVVTTTTVATTTTLAVTTGIPVMDVTRGTGVISLTDLLILCGQAGHLQKDCKKNTTASTSDQDDKKPGASGRVFAITEGHATNTSVREVEFNIELIPGSEPISKAPYHMAPI